MMNTTSSTQTHQHSVTFSSDESSIVPLTSTLSPVLISSSALIDHRIKCRSGMTDMDPNMSLPIKRSQGTPNIQALHEDSPVTFTIGPNEHFHGPIRAHIQTNSTAINPRTAGPILSVDNLLETNSSSRADESDSRSESSEKIPEYIEEDKPILGGIHVKGATLNRLIRILIDAFRKCLKMKHST
jgi:hypothetical protein